MAMVADELYVNYYLAKKQYDKAFEYGDKNFSRLIPAISRTQ